MNVVNNFFQASLNNFKIPLPVETLRCEIPPASLEEISGVFDSILNPRKLSAQMALASFTNQSFTLAPREQDTLLAYLDDVIKSFPEQRTALLVPFKRATAMSVLVEPEKRPVIAFFNNSFDNPLITRYDPSGEPSLVIKPLTRQAGVEIDSTKDFYRYLADLIIKLEQKSF